MSNETKKRRKPKAPAPDAKAKSKGRSVQERNLAGRRRILSMNGAGIYGLTAAHWLRDLCEADPDFLAPGQVWMFVGCSAGAVNSLLLAKHENPREAVLSGELHRFWEDPGTWTNSNPVRDYLSYLGMAGWYGAADFLHLLERAFGDLTMADLKHNVLISTFNYFGKSDIPAYRKSVSDFTSEKLGGVMRNNAGPGGGMFDFLNSIGSGRPWSMDSAPWRAGNDDGDDRAGTGPEWTSSSNWSDMWRQLTESIPGRGVGPDMMPNLSDFADLGSAGSLASFLGGLLTGNLDFVSVPEPDEEQGPDPIRPPVPDLYRQWRPRYFSNLNVMDRDYLVSNIGYAAATPPGFRAVLGGYGDGAAFTVNPSVYAIADSVRRIRTRQIVEGLIQESSGLDMGYFDETADILKTFAMLSIGDGAQQPWYDLPNFDWGFTNYYWYMVNRRTGARWTPDYYTLQPSDEEHVQITAQLLGPSFHRLNPGLFNLPMVAATFYAKWPHLRKAIQANIKRGTDSPLSRQSLARTLEFLKSPMWTTDAVDVDSEK